MHETPPQPMHPGEEPGVDLLQTLRHLRSAATPAPRNAGTATATGTGTGGAPGLAAPDTPATPFTRLVRGARSGDGAVGGEPVATPEAPVAKGPPPRTGGAGIALRTWRGLLSKQVRLPRLLASFLLVVVSPLVVAASYLLVDAAPQYASTVAFTVRTGQDGAGDALGGIARLTGAAGGAEAAILAEFLHSQTLIERLARRLDIVGHYSGPQGDPVFALSRDATVEDQLAHWRRMLRVTHDAGTGLIELRVLAFSPEMAQLIARELVVEGQALVNDLNARARQDATAQASHGLAVAEARLAEARAALTAFRIESGIAEPGSDIEGRFAVVRHLQAQLAQALAADGPADPADAERVAFLRRRIAEERALAGEEDTGPGSRDYPALLAGYERLAAERDFAEAAWRASVAAHDITLAAAARQASYLAVYIQPTLAERADHPRSGAILGLLALFLLLVWSIALLTAAAIRDRR